MILRLDSDKPLHLQIYRAFREAILTGRLPPGSRLPSSRGEARTLGVSRNVVLQAYGQLAAEGYLSGSIGSGTYVARELPESMLEAEAPRNEGAPSDSIRTSRYAGRMAPSIYPTRRALPYDFAYGLSPPDETTTRQWQRCLRRVSERLSLDYGPAEGEPRLREAIAAHLYRSRGVSITASRIVIVSGSQQALSLIARVLFDPGERISMEDPAYQGARRIFEAEGLRLVPCAVDEEGMDPAGLGAARGAYVTPSHQFPTGVTMPLGRRLQLLEWAETHDAIVIEDDYDSEYRYEGRPLEAIQSLDRKGRVIYVGTFSKVLFPALRLGFLALPEPLVAPFARAKWLADRHSASLEQKALAEFLASGEFEQHLRRMRTRNARRRNALLESLQERVGRRATVTGANAGIHLVAWLDEIGDVDALIERAEAEGVGLYSVAPYYDDGPSRSGLLFGYGNLDEGEIREGIRRFADLL